MTIALKPCPFCGRSAVVYKAFPKFEFPWHVSCDHDADCIIAGADGYFECQTTEKAAADRWNRRAAALPSQAAGSEHPSNTTTTPESSFQKVEKGFRQNENIANADSRERVVAAQISPDVRALVIAARIVAFEDQSPEALRALDKASEPFAERVPWENEPSSEEQP